MNAANITIGTKVLQYNDTIWGVRADWETVSMIRCDARDHLIEIELRNGPTLTHLLRVNPNATLIVRI